MTHRLENTLGFNPVRLGIYSQATGAEDHVGLPDQRKFAPLMPSYRSLLADLLGLRFIAAGAPAEQIDPKLKPGDLTFVARTADAYVYENPRTLPRVLFANEVRQANFDELLKTGAWPDFDPRTTILLEGQPAGMPRRPGSSAILSYAINEIVIRADSSDGGWVVLNDIWQPWWFATVDGRDAPVVRANVLFRAVEVPPGQYTVHLRFQPLRGAWAALRSRRAK